MGYLCQRCRRPLRARHGSLHVRCIVRPELADDILVRLKLPFSVTTEKLARDFGVPAPVMRTALILAQRRLRARQDERGAA